MFRMGKEEIDAVARVINSKQLFRINDYAREVDHFEEELSAKMGVEYSLCLTSGTAALISALAGLGIGPGDEVIIPGYTFMATATAVLAAGAIPVIIEVDDSLTIDPIEIEKHITQYTKAIIPVHLIGFPCNMDKIMEIAKKHNLKVLEDACQADGGSYKGKRLGTIGDAGAFSFNFYKIISAGEGGAVVTNNRTIYQRALVYHDGGSAFRPFAKDLEFPIFLGQQYRSNEITGAILREQLKKLDDILTDLRRVKNTFINKLTGVENVTFVRSNDSEGDCGTTLGFAFVSQEEARKFATYKSGEQGVNGWLPIDSDKHIYCNWEPILNKRFGHHPTSNPFNMPENKGRLMDYSKDMCPNTLKLLSQTVFISMNPDWSEAEIDSRIQCCIDALKK